MATHTTPSLCPNGYTHHTIPVAQWLHTPQHPCAPMATHTTPSLCPNGYTHHTIPVPQWLHTPHHPCGPMATHTTTSLCPNGFTHHTIPVALYHTIPPHTPFTSLCLLLAISVLYVQPQDIIGNVVVIKPGIHTGRTQR